MYRKWVFTLVLFILGMFPAMAMAQESVVIDLVIADLSREINVPQSQIEVESIKLVTWMDASLGCPQPGMTYGLVVTEGWYIVLRANDNLYPYHTDNDDDIRTILCSIESSLNTVDAVPLAVGMNHIFTRHTMMDVQFALFVILFMVTGAILFPPVNWRDERR